MKEKPIAAKELERRFDAGEDIIKYMDPASIRKPGLEPRRVNVDFPGWMVHWLDFESDRLGITRQSLIKTYINDRIEVENKKRRSNG